MQRKKILMHRITATAGQTTIETNGEVTIAADESINTVEQSLTVKVTSNDRSHCSGSATVST